MSAPTPSRVRRHNSKTSRGQFCGHCRCAPLRGGVVQRREAAFRDAWLAIDSLKVATCTSPNQACAGAVTFSSGKLRGVFDGYCQEGHIAAEFCCEGLLRFCCWHSARLAGSTCHSHSANRRQDVLLQPCTVKSTSPVTENHYKNGYVIYKNFIMTNEDNNHDTKFINKHTDANRDARDLHE